MLNCKRFYIFKLIQINFWMG